MSRITSESGLAFDIPGGGLTGSGPGHGTPPSARHSARFQSPPGDPSIMIEDGQFFYEGDTGRMRPIAPGDLPDWLVRSLNKALVEVEIFRINLRDAEAI